MLKDKKIAVIGAGIAGITAAKKFAAVNDVTLFDKSRGIGGRMTTRRVEDYHFDHGAQFFTARSEAFQALCDQAQQDNVIEQWQGKFVTINGTKVTKEVITEKRYVAKPQMNSLCKYVAADLHIELRQEIASIAFYDDKWRLQTVDNQVFDDFDYLILAIPSHQALRLLPQDFCYFDEVAHVKMSACFTLMLGFEDNLKLDFDAASIGNSLLSWMAVNSAKPERTTKFSLVVNADNQWADENIEADLEDVKAQMIVALKDDIVLDEKKISYQTIHRWRYANAATRVGKKSLFDPTLKLAVCGDWLISGRVESAFLSGMDVCLA